jgi:hypothetical protein
MEEHPEKPTEVTTSLDEIAVMLKKMKENNETRRTGADAFLSMVEDLLKGRLDISNRKVEQLFLDGLANTLRLEKGVTDEVNKALELASNLLNLHAAILRKGKQGIDFT